MRNEYVDAEVVDPESIPGVGRGMGQATSGCYTYYSPSGTKISVELPGPGGSLQETIREWLGMDSLVAGIPNGWLVVGLGAFWYFGRRRF